VYIIRPAFGIGRLQGVPVWWWIVLVWALSLPWVGFTTEAQWSRVHPIPFTDPADRLQDLAANIALFVPFGYLIVRDRGRRFGIPLAVLAATVVSLSAEATQLFSTRRYPSATDVVAAMAGAAAGAVLASRGRWFRHPGSRTASIN
jgi:glycopeptide antibiotics resistance protein